MCVLCAYGSFWDHSNAMFCSAECCLWLKKHGDGLVSTGLKRNGFVQRGKLAAKKDNGPQDQTTTICIGYCVASHEEVED